MKIEVWSDFVCPFCYIGKRKLEDALENFPHRDEVEIEFKSYQLDPQAPLVYDGRDYYEVMAEKFGTVERVRDMTANIKEQADLVGLNFNFAEMKRANTFKAHRLAKFAKEKNKELEMTELLLQAHFTDALDISDDSVLLKLAEEVGLDKVETNDVLDRTDKYEADVNGDINEAVQFEITGVPFFLFNRKFALSGAQPTEMFAQALKQVWEDENKQVQFENLSNENTDAMCDDDGNCDIK